MSGIAGLSSSECKSGSAAAQRSLLIFVQTIDLRTIAKD